MKLIPMVFGQHPNLKHFWVHWSRFLARQIVKERPEWSYSSTESLYQCDTMIDTPFLVGKSTVNGPNIQ